MLGFLIAAAAGFLTPQITDSLAGQVIRAMSVHIKVEPTEKRLVGFMLAMLAAGIAASLLHSGTPFWVILGGVLGYFGTRIATTAQKLFNGGADGR